MHRRTLPALALGLVLMGCGNGGEPPLVAEDILSLNRDANQVVFNLEHYVSSQGIRRALILADTAFFLKEQPVVDLRSMEVTFYDKTGSVASVLTAREGTYDWDSGDTVAEGDVVVHDPVEGRTLETSVLYYEHAADRIWSDQPTQLTEADGTVYQGTAFESTSGMDELELTSARVLQPALQPRPER